jgi:hypothetical protein
MAAITILNSEKISRQHKLQAFSHLLPYIDSRAYSKWRQRLRATQFRATAILLLEWTHVTHTLLNFVKICHMTQTLNSENAIPPFRRKEGK